MSYKNNATIAIDDSGNIDWNQVTGKPSNLVTGIAKNTGYGANRNFYGNVTLSDGIITFHRNILGQTS